MTVLAQEQTMIGFGTGHNRYSKKAIDVLTLQAGAQQGPGQLHALAETGHLWSPKEIKTYKGLLYEKCVCVCVTQRETERKKELS